MAKIFRILMHMTESRLFHSTLEKCKSTGLLSDSQVTALQNIQSENPLSLYVELKALLYIGVFSLLTGIGLTIKDHFIQIGHVAIIGTLSIMAISLLYYCFRKASAYANSEVASPNMAFDYALYLACTLYSIDVSYIETHFHLLGSYWHSYLLFSTGLFLVLAYRFDNRMVLSLSLGTFAAWFGFKLAGFHFDSSEYYRFSAIVYGFVVGVTGFGLRRQRIKAHFLDVYLNFSAHFILAALVSGTFDGEKFPIYFLALILLSGVTMVYALRQHKFIYMVYAVLYGYVGISSVLLRLIENDVTTVYLYFIFSSITVAATLVFLSRKFKEKT